MDGTTATFILTSDIEERVNVNILALEGQFLQLFLHSQRIANPELYKQSSKIKHNLDLIITVQAFNGNAPLTHPVQTLYTAFDHGEVASPSLSSLSSDFSNSQSSTLNRNSMELQNRNSVLDSSSGTNFDFGSNSNKDSRLMATNLSYRRVFNQWLTLPIAYRNLLKESSLEFKIYELIDGEKVEFGTCNIDLFECITGSLKKGYQQLSVRLNPNRFSIEPAAKSYANQLHELQEKLQKFDLLVKAEERQSMGLDLEAKESMRVAETQGDSINNEWVRKVIIQKIEKLSKKINKQNMNRFTLYFELVNFDVNVIYSDHFYKNKGYLAKNKNTIANNNDKLLQGNITRYNQRDVEVEESLISIDNMYDNASYSLFQVYDPEQFNYQPIELKYHQLERLPLSNYTKLTDVQLRPNLKTMNKLNKILSYSSIYELDESQKSLIFKFRYYLINNFKLNNDSLTNSNFLNFLLKSINWENRNEVVEISDILNSLMRNNLKISLTNTLELLGPSFNYNTLVRNFAINNLKNFRDDELSLYLLQLIQALKFDNYLFKELALMTATLSAKEFTNLHSSLRYVKVNGATGTDSATKHSIYSINEAGAGNTKISPVSMQESKVSLDQSFVDEVNMFDELSPLANFLIEKSVNNKYLGSCFYWYVKIESKDPENDVKIQLMFKKVMKLFVAAIEERTKARDIARATSGGGIIDQRLISRNNSNESNINDLNSISNSSPESAILNDQSYEMETGDEFEFGLFIEQVRFVKTISELTLHVRDQKKLTTPERQQFLKNYLLKNETDYKFFDSKNTEPLHLPLNPHIQILSVIAEECTVFKSSLSPLKLTFRTLPYNNGITKYSFMYKKGDDLRQDQLIIQIIKLIAKLLKDENLNLKLNPYDILATDISEGMMEFVPNFTLEKVLQKYQNIINFFQIENPFAQQDDEEYFTSQQQSELDEEMVNSKLQKVITRDDLLGVVVPAKTVLSPPQFNNQLGLDNPASKVHPKIMDNFVKSCAGYCVITYLLGIGDRHLDNLLICRNGQFFHVDFGFILGKDPKPFPPLMKLPIEIVHGFGGLDSKFYTEFKSYCYICFLTLRKNSNLILNLLTLMTYANIPDLKDDSKNSILKVQEKFLLKDNDEEAILNFQNLINDSVNAFFPVVIDKLHSLAQYWRA